MNVDLGTDDTVVARRWSRFATDLLDGTVKFDRSEFETFLQTGEALYQRLEAPTPSFFQSKKQQDTSAVTVALTQKDVCNKVDQVLELVIAQSQDPQYIRRLVALIDFWDLRRQLRLRPAAEIALREAAISVVKAAMEQEREVVSARVIREMQGLQRKWGSWIVLAGLLAIGVAFAIGIGAAWVGYSKIGLQVAEAQRQVDVASKGTHELGDETGKLRATMKQAVDDWKARVVEVDEKVGALDKQGKKDGVALFERVQKLEDFRDKIPRSYVTQQKLDEAQKNCATTEALKGYATTEALKGYATTEALKGYATTEALKGYATTEALKGYATTEALKGYATTEALKGYPTTEALKGYATTEALKGYATTEALKSYAKAESLLNYVTAEAPRTYLTISALRESVKPEALRSP